MPDYEFEPLSDASCVVCGHKLSWGERTYCLSMNAPPACANHIDDALQETEFGESMWPSDWHGHAYMRNDGKWWISEER
jgi:hypothetical protein